MPSEFLERLRSEMDALRVEPPALPEVEGVYGLLPLHNLSHYANSELAWTMNRNHAFPWWRKTIAN